MEFLVLPPALTNLPPTNNLSLEFMAREFTKVQASPIPAPRADQDVPFHLAIRLAVTPPAVVKLPAAYKLPLESIARLSTLPPAPSAEVTPVESADHDAPSHLAILLTVTPPATIKLPPAYRLPDESTSRAETALSMPVPNADHAVPFHLATLFTVVPSASGKLPPMYTLPTESVAMALRYAFELETPAATPPPKADQLLPFHLAMPLHGTPPTIKKLPPA
jgi:hypothetical protein